MISEVALETAEAIDDAVAEADTETLLAIECSADIIEERYEDTAELRMAVLMLVASVGRAVIVEVSVVLLDDVEGRIVVVVVVMPE